LFPLAPAAALLVALFPLGGCPSPGRAGVGAAPVAAQATASQSPPGPAVTPPGAPGSSGAPAASGSAATALAPASSSGAQAIVEPLPPTAAEISWLRVPVDHSDSDVLASVPDGGVLVLGENAFGIQSPDDLFLLRLSADGETIWQRRGTGRYVRAVAVGAGQAFLATEFSGRVNLDPVTVTGPGGVDAFVGAFGLDGSVAWGRVVSTADFDRAYGLAPTPDGGVVLALGAFVAPRSGPFAFTVAGGEDTVLAKWSAAGELAWLKTFGWPGYDHAEAVLADAEGHLLVAGTRWTSASTGAEALERGPCHGWVARLGPDSDTEWLHDLGDPAGFLTVSGMARSTRGRLVVTGRFRGRANLGAATLEASGDSAYVALLDGTGAVMAARATPAGGCLAVDAAGRILLSGSQGVLLVDPTAAPDAAPTWLLRWEKNAVRSIRGCAAVGAHHLIVGGTADASAKIGGRSLPAPLTTRFPHLPASSAGFVAKLAY